jgi:hypothetical protein
MRTRLGSTYRMRGRRSFASTTGCLPNAAGRLIGLDSGHVKETRLVNDHERVGQAASPTAGVLDSQRAKAAEAGGPRGYAIVLGWRHPRSATRTTRGRNVNIRRSCRSRDTFDPLAAQAVSDKWLTLRRLSCRGCLRKLEMSCKRLCRVTKACGPAGEARAAVGASLYWPAIPFHWRVGMMNSRLGLNHSAGWRLRTGLTLSRSDARCRIVDSASHLPTS